MPSTEILEELPNSFLAVDEAGRVKAVERRAIFPKTGDLSLACQNFTRIREALFKRYPNLLIHWQLSDQIK